MPHTDVRGPPAPVPVRADAAHVDVAHVDVGHVDAAHADAARAGAAHADGARADAAHADGADQAPVVPFPSLAPLPVGRASSRPSPSGRPRP